MKNSNVPKLVADMRSTKKELETSEEKLTKLRKTKNEGNVFSNFWHDRNDLIEDAESDLNGHFRKLGALSSDLLILNTAMAKIMNSQQGELQRQQVALNDQAHDIKDQNRRLKEHQELHANTLREFANVVEALKQAKSLTQNQAIELMKCSQRVAESERSMVESHGRLLHEVEERLGYIANEWSEALAARLSQFDDVHMAVEKRMVERLADSDSNAREMLAAAEVRSQEKCSQQVVESERNMVESHGRLMGEVEKRLRLIANECSKIVAARLSQFDDAHMAFEKRIVELLAASDADARDKLAAAEVRSQEISKKLELVAESGALLTRQLEKQNKDMRTHRIAHAIGGVAIVALFIWMAFGRAVLSH